MEKDLEPKERHRNSNGKKSLEECRWRGRGGRREMIVGRKEEEQSLEPYMYKGPGRGMGSRGYLNRRKIWDWRVRKKSAGKGAGNKPEGVCYGMAVGERN